MTLTFTEVEHIAELARLALTEEEKIRYTQQLSAILDYAARLQSLDTTGISASTGIPARSALRADRSRPGLTTEELLENAPETRANQFKVPPILD
ncbi:MAG: Asp-tRNA(Asn)/Glu-tRNA(Gln) amidotransferase subunit GatC [Anaerolineaceae bacterium]|nr:Asp-tRNA(Asn)/Glu-tRNA(Gln) amidotransferase subunit GatC [Anaerolineaceae bacterium]